MHVAVKRSIVAAAAVAAAGLYGSLSYDGQLVAQSGVPTAHHDVALVDNIVDVDGVSAAASSAAVTSGQFLIAENVFNGDAYGAFFSPGTSTGGLEYEIYHGAGTNASTLLDTYEVSGALPTTLPTDHLAAGIFDGATSQYLDGVYADGLLGEDYLNQALGVTASASETSILAQLGNDPFLDATTGTGGESTAISTFEALVPGTATPGTFDGDLAGLAQAFYTQSFTDLGGYETYLSDNTSVLTTDGFSLSTILGSVSTDLTNTVSGLSQDFTTFINVLDGFAGI